MGHLFLKFKIFISYQLQRNEPCKDRVNGKGGSRVGWGGTTIFCSVMYATPHIKIIAHPVKKMLLK